MKSQCTDASGRQRSTISTGGAKDANGAKRIFRLISPQDAQPNMKTIMIIVCARRQIIDMIFIDHWSGLMRFIQGLPLLFCRRLQCLLYKILSAHIIPLERVRKMYRVLKCVDLRGAFQPPPRKHRVCWLCRRPRYFHFQILPMEPWVWFNLFQCTEFSGIWISESAEDIWLAARLSII